MPNSFNFPIVSRGLAYLSSGRGGWSAFARGYSSARLIAVPGFSNDACRTPADAVRLASATIDAVGRSSAFETARFGRLNIIATHENAFCGTYDNEDGWTFPASKTLPASAIEPLRMALEEKADALAQATGEGVVIQVATTYSTGATDEQGRDIVVNRAILTAGAGQSLYIDKSAADPVDGLSSDQVIVESNGVPQALTVHDVGGSGTSVVLTAKICADLAKPSEEGLFSPDIVVVSAMGAPVQSSWEGNSVVAVSDGVEFGGATGVWAPADNPGLSGMKEVASGGFWAGLVAMASSWLSITPSRYQKLSGATEAPIKANGLLGTVKISEDFDIPGAFAPSDETYAAVSSNQVIALDPHGETYEPADPAPTEGADPLNGGAEPDA